MTLQDFCVAYGFPLTRTQRTTREIARNALKGRTAAEINLGDYGLKVRRTGASQRFSYDVYDADRFKQAMTRQLGPQALLTASQVAALVRAGRSYLDQLDEWGKAQRLTQAGVKQSEELRRVLRRVGAL